MLSCISSWLYRQHFTMFYCFVEFLYIQQYFANEFECTCISHLEFVIMWRIYFVWNVAIRTIFDSFFYKANMKMWYMLKLKMFRNCWTVVTCNVLHPPTRTSIGDTAYMSSCPHSVMRHLLIVLSFYWNFPFFLF